MKGASYAVVDVSVNSTTVVNGPAILYGVYVNTGLSAQVLPIQDGSSTVVSVAASAPAGDSVAVSDTGIIFETSLIVNPDDAATGEVVVVYRAIDLSGD
jgi:hypothetical protein